MKMNCTKCGKWMKRSPDPDVHLWVCRCGAWIASLTSSKTVQVIAQELLPR